MVPRAFHQSHPLELVALAIKGAVQRLGHSTGRPPHWHICMEFSTHCWNVTPSADADTRTQKGAQGFKIKDTFFKHADWKPMAVASRQWQLPADIQPWQQLTLWLTESHGDEPVVNLACWQCKCFQRNKCATKKRSMQTTTTTGVQHNFLDQAVGCSNKWPPKVFTVISSQSGSCNFWQAFLSFTCFFMLFHSAQMLQRTCESLLHSSEKNCKQRGNHGDWLHIASFDGWKISSSLILCMFTSDWRLCMQVSRWLEQIWVCFSQFGHRTTHSHCELRTLWRFFFTYSTAHVCRGGHCTVIRCYIPKNCATFRLVIGRVNSPKSRTAL